MIMQGLYQASVGQAYREPAILEAAVKQNWYAVFTIPQSEKSVVKHLDLRNVESFLPCYETIRLWKNRQRVKVILPLFPTYLFVHIKHHERGKVLQAQGVIQIVGTGRESIPLPDHEIELLRSGVSQKKIEPYRELVVGDKVRLKCGIMQGVQGLLVRKNDSLRFVFTLELINQSASIEFDAADLEPVVR
jgi:transcription antitermination factor NusG